MIIPFLGLMLAIFGQVQVESGDPAAPAPAATATEESAPDKSARAFGEWLVNLARHQGHLTVRTDPRGASLHVISLLEAAAHAAPDEPSAPYWLYDLYLRMGRVQQARDALARYVTLAPSDEGARLKRMELELAERQTSEARFKFIEDELKQQPRSRTYESALRAWLARYHHERGDPAAGGREIETALRLNPMNVEARRIAYELYGEAEPELQRVEMALQLISINPAQVNLVWDLAEFLDKLSLHRQAQEWYNRAIDLHRRAEAGPIAAELWQKLALSYICSRDYPKAREAVDQALQADASPASARLLRADVTRKLGDAKAADEDMATALKAFELRYDVLRSSADKEITPTSADEAAETAWFFCYHHPDPEKALAMSELAMTSKTPAPLARLAHGYALSAGGRIEEAMDVLEPLARNDQLAALELARCMIQRGQKSEAITLLHRAAQLQYSGIAYDLMKELLEKYDEKIAEPPLHNKIVAVLEKFPRDVFDYYRRTPAFLNFTLRFAESALPPTGSVDVVLRLENVGPFTITFGEGYMARPLAAISVKLSGGVSRTYDHYLQVMMSERPVLAPGDAFEKRVAIDVGAMREALLSSMTRDVEVTVTALFDPVYQDGRLASGLGTVAAGPIAATRPAVDAAHLAGLSDRASNGNDKERMNAADIAGALLATAEQDRASSNGSEIPAAGTDGVTSAAIVPVDRVREVLTRLLADPDPRVRAHALTAASWSSLDDSVTQAAAPLVRAQDPTVRVLAVRLFALKQGEQFRRVLEHLAQSDPSASVRTMAASFLPEEARVQAGTPDSAP